MTWSGDIQQVHILPPTTKVIQKRLVGRIVFTHQHQLAINYTICDVIWENLQHVTQGNFAEIKKFSLEILMFFFNFITLNNPLSLDVGIIEEQFKKFWK